LLADRPAPRIRLVTAFSGRRLRPVVRLESGRKVLRVAGIVQSVERAPGDPPDLWDTMVPRVRRVRRALVLGLGGGTIVSVILRRFPRAEVTGVDEDSRMLSVAREDFGLGHHERVRMVLGDAFAFVEGDAARYELIAVDLFRGGRMPPRVLSERFLLGLDRLADPRAAITFNLRQTSDIVRRIARLHRVLPVRATFEIGGNLVAHCAPAGRRGIR
jgi:spermidine synthase